MQTRTFSRGYSFPKIRDFVVFTQSLPGISEWWEETATSQEHCLLEYRYS